MTSVSVIIPGASFLYMNIREVAMLKAVVKITCDNMSKLLAEKGAIEAGTIPPTILQASSGLG